MKHLKWFEIEIYYPIDASLFEADIELSEVEKLSAGIVEGYEVGIAIFNLGKSTVQSLLPKCFIPKGKTNKKFYTEVMFDDGSFAFATAKPLDVYSMIDDYLDNFPEDSTTIPSGIP
jgi:hypothetical protein